VGNNCPIKKAESNITEVIDMDKEDIVEIVVKTISEMKAADDYESLQKKYDALVEKKATAEPEVKEPETVEKSLVDQVAELTATIEKMKTTPVQKGIQDGDDVVEKGATDITSMIVNRHYGGN